MKSKNVDITVTKSDVYLKVRRHSSYLGGKDIYNGNASDLDRISAAEADEVMLDQLWDKSLPLLVSLLQRYLFGSDKVTKNSTGVSISLTMPVAFNSTDNAPLLTDECGSFMSVAILIKWLETANAQDDVKQLTEELKERSLSVKDILARREMPVRIEPDMQSTVTID